MSVSLSISLYVCLSFTLSIYTSSYTCLVFLFVSFRLLFCLQEPRFFFTLSMDTYFKAWREVQAPSSSSSSSSFFSCILEGSYRGLPPLSCALSLDASLLAIAHGPQTITLWSPSSFSLLQSPLVLPPSSTLHSLAQFYSRSLDENEKEKERMDKKRGVGWRRYLEKDPEECRHIGLLESPYGLYLVAATTSCVVLYDLLSLSICWVKHFLSGRMYGEKT